MGDRLATIDMGRKVGVALPYFGGGCVDPSSRLACTLDMGRKVGAAVPLFGGEAWAEAYLLTKWHLDPSSRLAKTDMGRKLGAVPLWG